MTSTLPNATLWNINSSFSTNIHEVYTVVSYIAKRLTYDWNNSHFIANAACASEELLYIGQNMMKW